MPSWPSCDLFAFVAVGALLAVFRLLTGRAGAVGTGDILLFLSLGLDLVGLLTRSSTTTERNAILQNLLKV